MTAFINGIGLISPQQTTDPELFLPEICEYTVDFMKCIDPNYKEFINPVAGRRMSRLIKMGITSARIALLDAAFLRSAGWRDTEARVPDAIITGTGLGSVEDTEKILSGMLAGEELMNPSPFIQSTYNTISSQIAINLKCHNYNSTYVHRSFSFESALQDALLQFGDGSAESILAGGIDEMTENHLNITRRAGHWKMGPAHNLTILDSGTPGALAGEGAAFFLLESKPSERTYAGIKSVKTFYKPDSIEDIENHFVNFLTSQNLAAGDVDAVIFGYNGDAESDPVYDRLGSDIFAEVQQLWYKHLSGEYYTSTGFATWMAANILRHQMIPAIVKLNNFNPDQLQNILIYNQYRNINHSLILLKRVPIQ